jgi:hypothetical protein
MEEPVESNRIRCIEGRRTNGINFAGSVLEALGIPAREDDFGPFRTCTTCRFESDASAAADHDNNLPRSSGSRWIGEGKTTVPIVPPLLLVYFWLRRQQSESYACFRLITTLFVGFEGQVLNNARLGESRELIWCGLLLTIADGTADPPKFRVIVAMPTSGE